MEKETLADETFGGTAGWAIRPVWRRIRDVIAVRSALPKSQRDVRLDLFRGLANWLIFLGHIPDSVLAWFTTRNYGFGDGADLFVLISGYTATLCFRQDDDGTGLRHRCYEGVAPGLAALRCPFADLHFLPHFGSLSFA